MRKTTTEQIESFVKLEVLNKLTLSLKRREIDKESADQLIESMEQASPVYDISEMSADAIFSLMQIPYNISRYAEIQYKYGSSVSGDFNTMANVIYIHRLAEKVEIILREKFLTDR